jgi:ABC-type antimicrobial peptide transport system, ATPase component
VTGRHTSGELVLEATGLTRTFGVGGAEVHAVAAADLSVTTGELVVVRGRSGAGKTTLLELLGGLQTPDAGTVLLAGEDLATLPPENLAELRRRELGTVVQSFDLIPVLSAAENVEVPLRIARTPVAERDARVRELLGLVGLADHAAQRPAELSGGQQQRVAIARALASRPRLLLADEPTGQLDSETAASVMRLLRSLVDETGLAAVVTTHDPRVAAFADRVLEMHDGRLTALAGNLPADIA